MVPALRWVRLLPLAVVLLQAGGYQRRHPDCASYSLEPLQDSGNRLAGVTETLRSALVRAWCFFDKPDDDRPDLRRIAGLASQWQRCSAKWGGQFSPGLTLHLAWPEPAFDAPRFSSDIASLLSLAPSQSDVTRVSVANLTLPNLQLTIPHLLRVDFILQNVRSEHVPTFVDALRAAAASNATFRGFWRPVGALRVAGERVPTTFWDELRAQALIGVGDPLLDGARAMFSTEACAADSPAVHALVSRADEDQVVARDADAHLRAYLRPANYLHARWEVVAGSALLLDPYNATTKVRDLAIGRNVFAFVAIASVAGACQATAATISVTRVQDVPPPVRVRAIGTWHLLRGSALPAPHTSGRWCVGNGTADIGDPTRARTLATNLTLGVNLLLWVMRYSPTVETVESVYVEVIQEVGPPVPLAPVLALNDRIWALTLQVERLRAEVEARDAAAAEAQQLALQARLFAEERCAGLEVCPIPEPTPTCHTPDATQVIEPVACPPLAPCPACAPPRPSVPRERGTTYFSYFFIAAAVLLLTYAHSYRSFNALNRKCHERSQEADNYRRVLGSVRGSLPSLAEGDDTGTILRIIQLIESCLGDEEAAAENNDERALLNGEAAERPAVAQPSAEPVESGAADDAE